MQPEVSINVLESIVLSVLANESTEVSTIKLDNSVELQTVVHRLQVKNKNTLNINSSIASEDDMLTITIQRINNGTITV